MSKTAILEKVYQDQTDLANNLNILKDEFGEAATAFIDFQVKFFSLKKKVDLLASISDENCAEMYEHLEEPVLESKP